MMSMETSVRVADLFLPPPPSSSSSSLSSSFLSPSVFDNFPRVFSGHFHHHHRVPSAPHIVYVGAPMQLHFGDSGDDGRGIILFDPQSTDKAFSFLRNPNWDVFRTVIMSEYLSLLNSEQRSANGVDGMQHLSSASMVSGRHISLRCDWSNSMEFERIREVMLNRGAIDVRRHPVFFSPSTNNQPQAAAESPVSSVSNQQIHQVHRVSYANVIPAFVESVPLDAYTTAKSELIQAGLDIVKAVEADQKQADSRGIDSMPIFHARLKRIAIENFLGVRGKMELDCESMSDGAWFLEGNNGSGKSTVLESITWCLFDRFLRSNMTAEDAINDAMQKQCCVRVDFANGYSVERFRKYESKGDTGVRVYLNGAVIESLEKGTLRESQARIESLLGTDYRTFTKTVVLGDNLALKFLSSDERQRREIVEDLLGFDSIDRFLEAARSRFAQTEVELQQTVTQQRLLEETLNRLMNRWDGLKLELEDIASQLQTVDQHRVTVVVPQQESLEQERLRIETEQSALKDHLKMVPAWLKFDEVVRERVALTAKQTELDALGAELSSELQQIRKDEARNQQIKSILNQEANLSSQVSQLELQLQLCNESKSKLQSTYNQLSNGLSSNQCPTCQQSLQSEDAVKRLLTATNQQLEVEATRAAAMEVSLTQFKLELSGLLNQRSLLLSQVGVDLAELDRQISRKEYVTERLNQIKAESSAVASKLSQIEFELKSNPDGYASFLRSRQSPESDINLRVHQVLARQGRFLHESSEVVRLLQKLQTQSEMLKDRHRTLSEEQAVVNRECSRIKTELEASRQQCASLSNKMSVLNFWTVSFEKKQRLNNPLPNLRSFLLHDSIQELNQLLLKYSDILIEPQFLHELSIQFDSNLRIVGDYGKRSAGQRRRNDLAILFSLFELARQRSRFNADFIMLDEIFDALDVLGQEKVRDVIRFLSQYVSKVFIITHSSRIDTGHNLIRVSMTSHGTRMVDSERCITSEPVQNAVKNRVPKKSKPLKLKTKK
eukprot:GILJ01012369.1.p1 GENE.GILJ01012369.1~~GILJ01012369.1.p1  ORF type:complete len:1008 (+),score=211.30 GILJ01012369.1:64-3087(+)